MVLPSNLRAELRAGTLLQAHGKTVLTGLEMGVEIQPQDQHGLFFNLRLPVLFHQQGQLVYPGMGNPPGPAFYARPESALFAIREARYVKGEQSYGIGEIPLQENHSSILWGNPLINGETPYAANGFVFSNSQTELRTSALSDPTLIFFRHRWQGFLQSQLLALRTLQVEPQFFARIRQQYEGGGALRLRTTLVTFGTHQLGLEQSVSFIQREDVLWQQTTGFFVQFFDITAEAGGIAQSSNHPYGPYLSHATPGRFDLKQTGNKTVGGVYGSIYSSFTRHSAAFLRAEYYAPNVLSLRFDYEQKQGRATYLLGILREGIGAAGRTSKAVDPDMFFVLSLRYKAVADFLIFHSDNYYSYYQGMAYRGSLGLSWLF